VIKVTELDRSDALESEVMIARISSNPVTRGEIGDTAGLFGARMIDLAPDSITFELAGTPEHLGSFLDHMRPYGVVDLVKSGRVAMKKLSDVSRMVVGQP
jgi:acetolactate synthase-1/3 small subunit